MVSIVRVFWYTYLTVGTCASHSMTDWLPRELPRCHGGNTVSVSVDMCPILDHLAVVVVTGCLLGSSVLEEN